MITILRLMASSKRRGIIIRIKFMLTILTSEILLNVILGLLEKSTTCLTTEKSSLIKISRITDKCLLFSDANMGNFAGMLPIIPI